MLTFSAMRALHPRTLAGISAEPVDGPRLSVWLGTAGAVTQLSHAASSPVSSSTHSA